MASFEDLTDGAFAPGDYGYVGYEWGFGTEAIGADGTDIGLGYQNTIEIANQGTTVYGGESAAQTCLNYEINGYNDWYLPSHHELFEIFYTIGQLALMAIWLI